jgi:hypothetical protein
MLSIHDAYRDVMGMKGVMELSPQHFVVRVASDDVIGPPRASIPQ